MQKFILDCFTGSDNSTLDIGRVMWFMGAVYLCIGSACNASNFNPTEFSMAYSGLLVAGAGALRLKQTTEPKI
jgi:hypothetical protein